MANDLAEKTGCLEAYQKRCEDRAAIRWIQLKWNGNCRRGQKELILTFDLRGVGIRTCGLSGLSTEGTLLRYLFISGLTTSHLISSICRWLTRQFSHNSVKD